MFIKSSEIFIRAEGFNTQELTAQGSLGALFMVLIPECNTLLEQHTSLLAARLLIHSAANHTKLHELFLCSCLFVRVRGKNFESNHGY